MPRPAAFFRLEGVLLSRPPQLAAGWLAANDQRLRGRVGRLGALAAATPFALGLGDVGTGARLTWMGLRGLSEDRIEVLGEEYWATWLADHLRPTGVDLVERARREGLAVVLLSDHIEPIARHAAKALKADHLLANRPELRNGRATGRLVDPVVAHFGGRPLRDFAAQHDLDLAASRAYGSAASDQVLLSALPWPCAVHPDRVLRRVARELDWPVVEAS
jgi:phosphoserine phosphatase